jgi:hypothetical protein
MSAQEFTKEMARTMGERCAREREGLLMICHGLDTVRQLVLQVPSPLFPAVHARVTGPALQVLMRPSYALLDVCGVIPVDYLEGDLILPLYLPNNKIYVGLVARQDARSREYDPAVFVGEIGAPVCLFGASTFPLC